MIAEAVCKRILTAEAKTYRSAVGPGFVIVKLERGEFSVQERMFFPLNYLSVPNPFIYHPGDRKRALSRLQVKRRISVITKLQENILPVPTGVQNIYLFCNLLKEDLRKLRIPGSRIKILRKELEIMCKEEVVTYINVP